MFALAFTLTFTLVDIFTPPHGPTMALCWKGRTSNCWSAWHLLEGEDLLLLVYRGGVRRKLEGRGRRMRRGSVNKKTPLGRGKPTCASRPTMLFTFPKLWMRLDSHAVLSTAAAQSSSGRVDKPGSNTEPVAKKEEILTTGLNARPKLLRSKRGNYVACGFATSKRNQLAFR